MKSIIKLNSFLERVGDWLITYVDFTIAFGSSLGGIIGGWFITRYYHKKGQQEYREQKIRDKLESLYKDIDFAYKIQNEKERKERLQTISFINIQNQRKLLGNSVGDLQDILFRNSDNKEEVMAEITQVFKRYFPGCFN
ncbi:hypothetical protein [Helicobacter sp. MIT 14-3879]|uniref:hypothetical protein n=1 Tax=Helicobacter sp. MIT 14-3879 TaxID=2040649 RepID=UPI000E1E6F4A|nr:hypothetical protein [Helicobacter sp. MIT 14-3879]RDU61834.1 hypothetical protein CQA44_07860 [Helicobacter sp. MIT 14-3879]